MRIDMQKLANVSQGNPDSRISVNKVWLNEVAATLEALTYATRPYDTTVIRQLANQVGDPKVSVERRWLSHLYTTLSGLMQTDDTPEPVKEPVAETPAYSKLSGLFDMLGGKSHSRFGHFFQ